MNLQFRSARPDDADFLALIILLASRSHLPRGAFDVMVNRSEQDSLRYVRAMVCAELRSFCHYSGFTVAEVDGKPAAALCGFDPREGGFDVFPTVSDRALREMGWSARERNEALERLAPVATCFPDTAEGAWIVENVATLPEFRRRGIGELLLRDMLQRGRQRRNRVAQITFFIGNLPAERAYEKVGFTFADEKRNRDFESLMGSPGFRRMLLHL